MCTDFWLPRPSTFRVLTSPPYHSANTRVSSLVNLDNGDWNVHVINQLFLPTDVISILSIPLSHHKPRDELVWAYTPRGNFTVNNAYKVAISMARCNPVAETSHGALHTSFWRKIWNLHTPKQDKAFYLESVPRYSPYKSQPLPSSYRSLTHQHAKPVMLNQRRWNIFFGTALSLKRFGAPRISRLIATDLASCTSRIFFCT